MSIDEYLDLNESYIQKVNKLKVIVCHIESSINRLCDARVQYSNDEGIKEAAVNRWISRYEKELKK